MGEPSKHHCSPSARLRRTARVVTVATCIGCGCTDDRACPGGCSWIIVERTSGIGVCTRCSAHLDEFHAKVEAALAAREAGEA